MLFILICYGATLCACYVNLGAVRQIGLVGRVGRGKEVKNLCACKGTVFF